MHFVKLSTVSVNVDKNSLEKLCEKPEKSMFTYFAKYLNILCHLSLDTLPFMLTYFFGGVLSEFQGKDTLSDNYKNTIIL